MILDLHTHTKEHSACCHQSAAELVQKAAQVGLDGIVVTDHDHLWEPAEAELVRAMGRKLRLLVLSGREVSSPDGHLLVYGIEGPVPGDISRIELAHWVREHGGASVLPHPFRWGGFAGESDEKAAEYLRHFEAVEGWTTNHTEAEIARAKGFHRMPGIRLVGSSDAHSPDRVGRFATRFAGRIESERDVVEALKGGAGVPVQLLEPGRYVSCF